MPFDGLRVLSLESRRAVEIERLIRKQGGLPFVAPSMREIPLENNPEALAFAERLLRGDFDMMILLTGVGTRLLGEIIATRWKSGSKGGAFADALAKIEVVARGPKPIAVLREWEVPVTIAVPEPNTWREILAAIEARPDVSTKSIAVQEYGRPSPELIEGLRARGAKVATVPVYQWDLPADCEPLREAVTRLCASQFDVALFTTSVQIVHLLKVAREMGREEETRSALVRIVIASVGPATSEALTECGIPPDFEPSHPKMGFLVNETAANAGRIRSAKSAKPEDAGAR
jgi:uroporphyrinogen-III synthase